MNGPGTAFFTRHEVRSADGLPLQAFAAGAERSPVALLINAYGMPVQLLEPLARCLCASHRVVTWESRILPGPWTGPDTPADSAAHARDALSVLQALGRGRAEVAFGWCTGARVALHAGAGADPPFAALVLLSGSYRWDGVPRSAFDRQLEAVLRAVERSPAAARFAAAGWRESGAAAGIESNGLADAQGQELRRLTSRPFQDEDGLRRYAALCCARDEIDDRATARSSAAALLIAAAAEDRISDPEASRLLAQAAPGASFQLFRGDHYGIYRAPETIAAEWLRFRRERSIRCESMLNR